MSTNYSTTTRLVVEYILLLDFLELKFGARLRLAFWFRPHPKLK